MFVVGRQGILHLPLSLLTNVAHEAHALEG